MKEGKGWREWHNVEGLGKGLMGKNINKKEKKERREKAIFFVC